MLLTLGGLALLSGYAIERRGRSRPHPAARFDAIVVLGCPVTVSGEASPTLRRRALLAAELFRAGHADVVVVTGGVTRRGLPSEAEAAARVLEEAGVPRAAVQLEARSRTTRENASFTAALGPHRAVLIVTDAYHVPRARLLFRPHFSLVEGAGALGSWPVRLKGMMRELPLLPLAWMRHRAARNARRNGERRP